MKFFIAKLELDKKYDYLKLKLKLDNICLRNESNDSDFINIKINEVKIIKDYENVMDTEYEVLILIGYIYEYDIDYLIGEGYYIENINSKAFIESKEIYVEHIKYINTTTLEEWENSLKDTFNLTEYKNHIMVGSNCIKKNELGYKKLNNINVLINFIHNKEITMIISNGFLKKDIELFELVEEIKEKQDLNITTFLLLPYRKYGELLKREDKEQLIKMKNKANYIFYTDEFKECLISFCKKGDYHKLKNYKNLIYITNLKIPNTFEELI